MSGFDKAIAIVLKHEGGYVNDPADPGGETNFGISKRAYPKLDIAALTKVEAQAIYKRDYWEKAKCDQIADPQLAVHVFDMSVNAGIGAAAKLLQKASGATVDGKIGSKTLNSVNGYPRTGELLMKYKYERIKFYATIVGKNHKLAKFIGGWINRIETTNIYAV